MMSASPPDAAGLLHLDPGAASACARGRCWTTSTAALAGVQNIRQRGTEAVFRAHLNPPARQSNRTFRPPRRDRHAHRVVARITVRHVEPLFLDGAPAIGSGPRRNQTCQRSPTVRTFGPAAPYRVQCAAAHAVGGEAVDPPRFGRRIPGSPFAARARGGGLAGTARGRGAGRRLPLRYPTTFRPASR